MADMSPIKETSYDNSNRAINPVAYKPENQRPLDNHPSGRTCCQTHARQIEKAGKCAQWIAWGIVIAIIIIMGISGGLVFGGLVSFGSWTIGTLVLDSTTKIGLAILSMEGGAGIILLLLDYGVYHYRIHGASCPDDLTVRQTTAPDASNMVTSTASIPTETPLLNAIDEQNASQHQSHRLSEHSSSYDIDDGQTKLSNTEIEKRINQTQKSIAELEKRDEEHSKTIDQLEESNRTNQISIDNLEANGLKQDEMLSQLKKESQQLKENDRKQDQTLHKLKENDRKQTKTLDDLEAKLIVGKQKLQDLEKRMQRLEQTTHTTQPKQTSQTLIVVTMQPPNHKFIV